VKRAGERDRAPPPQADPPAALQKRRQPGRIRAFILAVAVHAAFFALIVFGVTWQSSPTAPLVAELWDKLPPVARPEPPKPEPPKPEPEPPKPEPEKKPEPPKPEPPKPDVKPEPPKPDPAIAEKAKREKEKRERLEREKEEKRKAEEAKKKREQEDAARKKQEDDRKRREEDARKREEDARKREAEKARAEAAARQRTEIDKYVDAIRSKIRGKANVPDSVTGNPEVQVRLRVLPGGDVLEASITRSSGNRAYDSAIERAIRSASPLPVPPADSELFPQFRDLTLNIRHER
jgi:colicin import membrane protein